MQSTFKVSQFTWWCSHAAIERNRWVQAKFSPLRIWQKLRLSQVKKVMFISQIPGEELNSKSILDQSIRDATVTIKTEIMAKELSNDSSLTRSTANIHNGLPMHFLFLNIVQKIKQCFYTDITVQKFGVGKIFLMFLKVFYARHGCIYSIMNKIRNTVKCYTI